MEEYIKLIKLVLKKGTKKDSRTIENTLSYFGTQSRYSVSHDAFPLITVKKTWWKGIVHELLWFIKGDTNIKYLVENNVNIWNEWPYKKYLELPEYKNETLKEFIDKIKNDSDFAKKYGDLGPVYGKQWRNFNNVDQLSKAIEMIKNNPNSRRIIVSAWNPSEVDKMMLPPCHSFFQFYVINGVLSLQLYQRSADLFLGVPFNIASYSLLLLLVADITNLKSGEFVHTIGDAHIYNDHMDQVDLMFKNKPLKLPKIIFKKHFESIDDINYDDIELKDYNSHPKIPAKVAV